MAEKLKIIHLTLEKKCMLYVLAAELCTSSIMQKYFLENRINTICEDLIQKEDRNYPISNAASYNKFHPRNGQLSLTLMTRKKL